MIERVRASLSARVESRQVTVGGRRNFDGDDDDLMLEHPTFGILALARNCDVAVVDDRFINQHVNIDFDGNLEPLLSTLDLLDALVSSSVISQDDLLAHRTDSDARVISSIPVNADELGQCLMASTVVEGKV